MTASVTIDSSNAVHASLTDDVNVLNRSLHWATRYLSQSMQRVFAGDWPACISEILDLFYSHHTLNCSASVHRAPQRLLINSSNSATYGGRRRN